MSKDIDRLLQALENLMALEIMKKVTIEGPFKYDVKKQWFSDSESHIPKAECNGIYFYTKKNGEVLYIGKGEYSDKGGIGHRSCSHLGASNRGSSNMFPFHEWVDNEKIKTDIRGLIANGDFFIWTLPVEPGYFASLIEIYLQTSFKQMNAVLPPLNMKIG